MTAYQILLHELAQHGSLTYRDLTERHPEYGRTAYAAAVYKACRLGIARTMRSSRVWIVAVGACPCCGRALVENKETS